MSALDQISYFRNQRDEAPNQELAKELAQSKDQQGIEEIAANLTHKNSAISSDCLKVLYEIGYLAPQLIADYDASFLMLLKSKNNRLVWGSMIALSTIAHLKPQEIGAHLEEILFVIDQGSVITVDNGIKTLAIVASHLESQAPIIFPYLINHLNSCRAKDVPGHAEAILTAVDASNKNTFITAIEKRIPELTGTQTARVKKVIRTAEKR
jgi:hypothetical protein